MEADYRTHEYEMDKVMEKQSISFWYIQTEFPLTSCSLPLTNQCSWQFQQHHPQLSPHLQSKFCRFESPFQHQIDYTLEQARFKGELKLKKSPYPGCHKICSALSNFFRSLDKGRMWRYNILGDKQGKHITSFTS